MTASQKVNLADFWRTDVLEQKVLIMGNRKSLVKAVLEASVGRCFGHVG